MANFPGGSVYSMVQGISSGSYLVTEKSFKRLLPPEIQQLAAELERQVRLVRGDQPPPQGRSPAPTPGRRGY